METTASKRTGMGVPVSVQPPATQTQNSTVTMATPLKDVGMGIIASRRFGNGVKGWQYGIMKAAPGCVLRPVTGRLRMSVTLAWTGRGAGWATIARTRPRADALIPLLLPSLKLGLDTIMKLALGLDLAPSTTLRNAMQLRSPVTPALPLTGVGMATTASQRSIMMGALVSVAPIVTGKLKCTVTWVHPLKDVGMATRAFNR